MYITKGALVSMRDDILHFLSHYLGEEVYLLNKAELARRFGCDPRTIDKYIKIANGEYSPRERKHKYKSKIDEYKDIIINKVDVYGCTAMAAYKFIAKKGYTGKYSIVADFVAKHKDIETRKATIRFETNPGLQAQVDWKEDMTLMNVHGEVFKINIFLIVLGYSRLKYIELTTDRSQTTLFSCLMSAFMYFGGVTNDILFDNMKTVVDHSKTSFTHTVFNEVFTYFAKDAGFKPIACRPYRPQTKGKVESLAKLTERLRAYNEEFETWNDLKLIIKDFMKDINNEISQATGKTPIDMFQQEKEHLQPLPDMYTLYSYISDQEEKQVKVSRESMIKYEGRKYSVPTKYIGEKMTANSDDSGNLNIYYNGHFVISHQISSKMYNYTLGTACEILKSDAMKHKSDKDILHFVQQNLLNLDKKLGEQ